MPANRFNGFTEYGIGIGLRAPHYNHILTRKPVCDWFEIISENFMIDGGRPLHILEQILEQYKVVQHGVSMYFGSAEKPNREHLRRLKELVKRTKTPWLSDHLCWGSVDGRYTHDLLPMPYTFEAAKLTAQKVREVRDFLEIPIAVENVSSYAEFHVSEMTEWEFLNEVVERADCGILLDVNNIYVSSQNHSFDPMTYVNSVPAERVAQIHIAGHSKYRKYILDTHDHPVIDPVWKLYERAVLREKRFDAMCKAYLVDCPSTSFTLRNLGSKLELWLRKHPQWAGKKQALALDLVRLEWADIEAFDGAAEVPLEAQDLAGIA